MNNPIQTKSSDEIPIEIQNSKRSVLKCGMRITALRDINHLDGTFHCQLAIIYKWNDPANIGKPIGSVINFDQDKMEGEQGSWFPIPRIENAQGELLQFKDTIGKPTILNSETGEAKFTQILSGKFVNVMDLRNFPFDVQCLEIRIRFPHGQDRCRIESLPMSATSSSSVVFENSTMLLDWDIRSANILTEYPKQQKDGKLQLAKPQFRLVIPLERAWWHHVLHIVIVVAGLTTCNFYAFFLPFDDLSGRSQIILTLLLTVIATKFLVKEQLPAVPFVTPLDMYTYGAMSFFALAIIETAAVSTMVGDKDGKKTDNICSYLWLALWLSFNIWWVVYISRIVAKNTAFLSPVEIRAGSYRAPSISA